MKTLKMSDVLKDKIDQYTAPAEAPRAAAPTINGKKVFRTRTGEYTAVLEKTWLRIADGGTHEGRRYVSILAKLSEGGRFRGSAFIKASWKLVVNESGKPDLQFRLFQQIVQALGAPANAEPSEVLEAIPGETVRVWGKEYYIVPTGDLLPEHASQAGSRATTYVFIDEGDDDAAMHYINKGIEPKFMIMRVSELAA